MRQRLAHIAIVVRDYDEAIRWYTEVLNFELIEDTYINEQKRWVLVRPPGDNGCQLLLSKAKNEVQMQYIGNQTGGRVFLFLHTSDFDGDLANLHAHNVEIYRGPFSEEYGRVVVFVDLYGNLWDLIEPVEGLPALY